MMPSRNANANGCGDAGLPRCASSTAIGWNLAFLLAHQRPEALKHNDKNASIANNFAPIQVGTVPSASVAAVQLLGTRQQFKQLRSKL